VRKILSLELSPRGLPIVDLDSSRILRRDREHRLRHGLADWLVFENPADKVRFRFFRASDTSASPETRPNRCSRQLQPPSPCLVTNPFRSRSRLRVLLSSLKCRGLFSALRQRATKSTSVSTTSRRQIKAIRGIKTRWYSRRTLRR